MNSLEMGLGLGNVIDNFEEERGEEECEKEGYGQVMGRHKMVRVKHRNARVSCE
jgi:hypothetical protein